jgi:UDP-GlcNAc:undecaprenyl-phosphate GlcNAc-1-phosphate transferase
MKILIYLFLLVLIPFISYFFYKRLGWMDKPKKYGFERKPVPYGFGLVLYLLFLVGVALFLPLSGNVLAILVGVSLLVGISFWDDRLGLPSGIRLLVQLVAAFVVVYGGGAEILEVAVPFEIGILELGVLGGLVSVIWVVALTNMMNFLDGVSGLSSVVSFCAFGALTALASLPGVHVVSQELVVGMGVIMMILSFIGMVLEIDSPKVLLGDTGTMFFGFMLAVLSMINGGKLATLGLVLIVPILDGIAVLVMRVLNGRKPWEGDFNHLHHLLLRRGMSRRQIVMLYGLFSLGLMLVSVFFWNSVFKFIVLGLSVIGIFFVILYNHKKYADWRNFDKLESS